MSILIDKLKKYENITTEINGKWYIAKPTSYTTLKGRIKDCIKILRNKAIAIHYKEDEQPERRRDEAE